MCEYISVVAPILVLDPTRKLVIGSKIEADRANGRGWEKAEVSRFDSPVIGMFTARFEDGVCGYWPDNTQNNWCWRWPVTERKIVCGSEIQAQRALDGIYEQCVVVNIESSGFFVSFFDGECRFYNFEAEKNVVHYYHE